MMQPTSRQPHITVCICTYRRPRLLESLLRKLADQCTEGLFSYSILVVDNDSGRSAAAVVAAFKDQRPLDVDYLAEPVQNISLARNKAVLSAHGDYLALIDDDELPPPDWLSSLYTTMIRYQADGVLGPVVPEFAVPAPQWLIQAGLCERERFPTGTWLPDPRCTRTGNALLARCLFDTAEPPFDPRLGLTGGEDTQFFRKMMQNGKKFVWSDEAPVRETVPVERLKAGYFLKRALLRGVANAQGESLFDGNSLRSLAAIACYLLALPLLLAGGRGRFMRALVSMCDHSGKILALLGVRVITKRTF